MQLRHLAMAERHIAQGVRLIAEQEDRIAVLELNGSDISESRRLLKNFKVLQNQHLNHRERILRELAQ